MHFPWPAQYKRHVHQRCSEVRVLTSWAGLHFGASGLQVRWFCVTGATLCMTWPHFFRGRRNTLDRWWWNGKISKCIGTKPSALHSTFHFWRKSRRTASFLMLGTSKIEEVTQYSFAFDVVKFKNWGSLAELLRFWCCQVQKLRKFKLAGCK